MAALIVKSPQYDFDIEAIWLHIAADNRQAADRVVLAIEQTVSSLADFPGLGMACPHLAADLRRVLWRDYVIYRWRRDVVELVRVLHARRDIKPLDFPA